MIPESWGYETCADVLFTQGSPRVDSRADPGPSRASARSKTPRASSLPAWAGTTRFRRNMIRFMLFTMCFAAEVSRCAKECFFLISSPASGALCWTTVFLDCFDGPARPARGRGNEEAVVGAARTNDAPAMSLIPNPESRCWVCRRREVGRRFRREVGATRGCDRGTKRGACGGGMASRRSP